MTDTDGLSVVLNCATQDWLQTLTSINGALAESQSQSRRLDELEGRISLLPREAGVNVVSTQPKNRFRSELGPPPTFTWEQLRESAEKRLRARSVDLSSLRIDDLLDPQENRRIESRFRGGFTLTANLDRFDVIAAIAAGLVAAAADFLVVRIPKDIVYLGRHFQTGSPLTKWIQSLEVSSDNWLARNFKTAFDQVVVDREISGFGPRTHRLQTLGHDPLVGLIVGTIDIIRGGLSAVSKSGELIFLSGTGTPQFNPFTALVFEIGHLLSDCSTKMGIPPPGFSLAQILQVGSFGANERSVADLARFMYLKGYDSRHFLTMSTSVAAAEVVLRGYFAIRRKLDENYEAQAVHSERASGRCSMSAHPTFQAMAFVAHLVGSAANGGKVAFYGGNPLAVNYAQWLRFLQAALSFTQARLRSPSEVLIGHARANLMELDEGWPTIEVSAADFPSFVVGERTDE